MYIPVDSVCGVILTCSPLSLSRQEVGKEEEEANQHKIETIELPNEGQGFGFGVIPREDKKGTKVHSIVQGGIADKVTCWTD